MIVQLGRIASYQSKDSSRVSTMDNDRIVGAASSIMGDMTAQETSQEASQFDMNCPVAIAGKLAMPAAIWEVDQPDAGSCRSCNVQCR